MKIKSLDNDIIGFTTDKEYNTYPLGNNLIAIDDYKRKVMVAYNVMHQWEKDNWFMKHFEVIK